MTLTDNEKLDLELALKKNALTAEQAQTLIDYLKADQTADLREDHEAQVEELESEIAGLKSDLQRKDNEVDDYKARNARLRAKIENAQSALR